VGHSKELRCEEQCQSVHVQDPKGGQPQQDVGD